MTHSYQLTGTSFLHLSDLVEPVDDVPEESVPPT
jgi:hypothetical protein